MEMSQIEALVSAFEAAKREEEKAVAHRRELGDRIAAELAHPEEGSKTHTVGHYKVVIKGTINRKVDWALFDAVQMPNGIPAPVINKPSLDVVGLKWIQDNEPSLYARLATAITAKPGAVQVVIK